MKEKQLEYLPFVKMAVNGQKEMLHEAYEETEQCEVIKTQMQRAYNPWLAAYQEYMNRYETPLGNVEITKPIHQLDSQRDSVLFAIDVTARAALKSIDPETVAAAEAVEQTRVSFPVNPNAGYLSQTAQLDFYLGAMLGAQLENVTRIGALPLVQNLKAINDQIHALVDERDDERASQVNEPGRTAARQAAVAAWDYLRLFVNGYNLVVVDPAQPNAELDRYIDKMNVKIRRYRDIYIGAPAKPGDGEPGSDGDSGEGGEGGENTGGSGSGTGSGTPGGGENNTPGGGTNTPGGGGSENTVTVVFEFHGGRAETVTGVPGTAMTKPANTEGYMWPASVPSVFPAENATYTEVEDNRQEYQITYMDANNEDEFDIQMVKEGDPIVPPTPPTGYHWVDVPAIMPARNIYIRCAADA